MGKLGGDDFKRDFKAQRDERSRRGAHVAYGSTLAWASSNANIFWQQRAGAMGGGTDASWRWRRIRVMTDSWVMAAMIRSEPRRQHGALPLSFARSYRASEGGRGPGLPLGKELVEAHGGHIDVATAYGKGSTFTRSFPGCHLHNPFALPSQFRCIVSSSMLPASRRQQQTMERVNPMDGCRLHLLSQKFQLRSPT